MYELPKLQYQLSDLAPFLTEEQMRLHYEAHHAKYIENMNKMIEGNADLEEKYLEDLILDASGSLFDNAAQAWNHTFFWFNLAPKNTGGSPSPQFLKACENSFGTMDDMFKAFNQAGEKLFGSGWVWLCADQHDRLHVITTNNADVPWKATTDLRPLMLADVWEHAYYLDYRNQRRAYLDEMKGYFNWNFINENFKSRYLKSLHREMLIDKGIDEQVSQAV